MGFWDRLKDFMRRQSEQQVNAGNTMPAYDTAEADEPAPTEGDTSGDTGSDTSLDE